VFESRSERDEQHYVI